MSTEMSADAHIDAICAAAKAPGVGLTRRNALRGDQQGANHMHTDEVQMRRESVDPQMAEEWLRHVRAQRKLRRTVVGAYAADMAAGRWAEDITPIAFNEDGDLVNGQHRLNAVISSGTTQTFWVRRGVANDAIWRMDQGAPRSVGDQLHINGVANRTEIAAVVRMRLAYHRIPDLVWGGTALAQITKASVFDEAMSNVEFYQNATRVGKEARRGTLAHANSYSTLWTLVQDMSSSADMWDEFHDGLVSGAALLKGDPRLAFRNYCVRRDIKKWGVGQSSLLAIIKTWNRYVDDEPTLLLKSPRSAELPLPKVK